MISARFTRNAYGIRLLMQGHADYAEGQADIVCAAVSGIFYSLIGYLSTCTKGAHVNCIEHGYADVECSLEGEGAMKQTCIGLIQIENSYPECVRVTDEVWMLDLMHA